jgi:SpoIID/LytB domain protein
VLTQKSFLLAGTFFGGLIFATAPSQAQTLQIRLFEIFHPQSLEIRTDAPRPAVDDSRHHLSKANRPAKFPQAKSANRLVISVASDSLRWLRIDLTVSNLQIHSAGFSRSLGLMDTVNIAATENYFLAAIPQAGNAMPRPYSGALKIYKHGNALCIINLTPVEDYLAGILAAEMPQAELPALQAQAVVSRTYILKNRQRHSTDGYQFCDLTHCQTYKGEASVTPAIRQAVTSTTGEILTFNDEPISAYYSSTCGGTTADDIGVWANTEEQPYLKSIADESFCSSSPHYRWRARISADSLHQIWQRRLGDPVTSLTITKKGADGRVRELALMGHSLHLMTGEDFRAVTCRAFGWNTLKSTWFDVQIEKRAYFFNGRGLGHGLGFCQYGAMEMARRGYSYQGILQRYFPGTEIQKYGK